PSLFRTSASVFPPGSLIRLRLSATSPRSCALISSAFACRRRKSSSGRITNFFPAGLIVCAAISYTCPFDHIVRFEEGSRTGCPRRRVPVRFVRLGLHWRDLARKLPPSLNLDSY